MRTAIEVGAAAEIDYVHRKDVAALLLQEFTKFDPTYRETREPLKREFGELSSRLDEFQKLGRRMSCSDQIRNEVKWLLNYRADWKRLGDTIAKLRASLTELEQGESHQGADGSWGGCTSERYRKLEPTIDELQSSQVDESRLLPLSFISNLAEPAALVDYLWRLQVSDIAKTGENNRDELGAVQSAFSQLIYKDELRSLFESPRLNFPIGDALENAYGDFMHQTQHPRTGYWGPWYRADGRLLMVQDLSYTFHHINFRGGNVSNWDRIAETTLRIRDLTYPNGWKPKGENAPRYSDHNNYDVVQIFCRGWPYMPQHLRQSARDAIHDMLGWCLTESVDGTGFRGDDPFEALYFGVRFLDRVGYWDVAKRFWSPKPLQRMNGSPSPVELANRLSAGLQSLQVNTGRGETVRNILRSAICVGTAPEQHAS